MVTFKNEDKAVDDADVEAACPVANTNGNGGLSKSSRAWDLDGDGELGKPSLLSFVVDSITMYRLVLAYAVVGLGDVSFLCI